MTYSSTLPLSGEDTIRLQKNIINCSDDKEYYNLIIEQSQRLTNKETQWTNYYNDTLKKEKLSPRRIEEMSGISFRTAYSWCHRTPVKREHYVALGIIFKLTVSQTNALLTRYGELTSLDDSRLEDLVFIYMIEKALKDNNPTLFLDWSRIRNDFLRIMLEYKKNSIQPYLKAREPYSTIISRFDTLNNVNESVKDIFRDWFSCIGKSLNYIVNERNLKPVYQRNYTRIDAEIPSRNFIIALGLQIGMPMSEINNVLSEGMMESLCSKDRIEGALIHILNMLYKKSPSFTQLDVMKSPENIELQKVLPGGNLPSYIYNRMHSDYIAPLIADTKEEQETYISKFLFL